MLCHESRFIIAPRLGPLLQCVDRGEGVQPQIPAQLDQMVLREVGVSGDQPLPTAAVRVYLIFCVWPPMNSRIAMLVLWSDTSIFTVVASACSSSFHSHNLSLPVAAVNP